MRLINTRTFVLRYFGDEETRPPYAILSHTWGNEEVNLQQFERLQLQKAAIGDASNERRELPSWSHDIMSMHGYQKIKFACQQAREDSHGWVWVDTCCIDKTSSSELSEAINSMFKWYEEAEVCYAFLEDVDIKSADEIRPGKADEVSLGQSRWFTRGWTLQELIAPHEVKFFGKGWTYGGSKSKMTEELTRITGIDIEVLDGQCSPRFFCIAVRMSWAAGRNTTRKEDLAYCLLGIFDVNMSLIYGEGEKAFARLQEQILMEIEDQSLFGWSPEPSDELQVKIHPQGTSIFARHPRCFLGLGKMGYADHNSLNPFVRPLFAELPSGEPSVLTNRGIKMESPVLRYNEPGSLGDSGRVFYMILCCSFTGGTTYYAMVPLRRLFADEGSHTYARHESAPVAFINSDHVEDTDGRHIFLRKVLGPLFGVQLFRSDASDFEEAREVDDTIIRSASYVQAELDRWCTIYVY